MRVIFTIENILSKDILTCLIPSAFRILVYNDFISKEKRYELSETNSIGYLPKEVLVSSTTLRFLQQLFECVNQHIHKLLRYDNSFNLPRVFRNYSLYVFYDFR